MVLLVERFEDTDEAAELNHRAPLRRAICGWRLCNILIS